MKNLTTASTKEEMFEDKVALRSYQEGYRLQLTHIDRDNEGHKAHVLEASRILYFSIFTKGTAYIPLWQSGEG